MSWILEAEDRSLQYGLLPITKVQCPVCPFAGHWFLGNHRFCRLPVWAPYAAVMLTDVDPLNRSSLDVVDRAQREMRVFPCLPGFRGSQKIGQGRRDQPSWGCKEQCS